MKNKSDITCGKLDAEEDDRVLCNYAAIEVLKTALRMQTLTAKRLHISLVELDAILSGEREVECIVYKETQE